MRSGCKATFCMFLACAFLEPGHDYLFHPTSAISTDQATNTIRHEACFELVSIPMLVRDDLCYGNQTVAPSYARGQVCSCSLPEAKATRSVRSCTPLLTNLKDVRENKNGATMSCADVKINAFVPHAHIFRGGRP